MSPMNERLHTLRRRFIGLTAASATALALFVATAIPGPAHADDRELGKLLFGIATIALIAKALDDHKDKKKHTEEVVVVPPKQDVTVKVPSACALDVSGLGNDHRAYAESCLQSYGFRQLPYQCAVTARVYGRPEQIFPASCLRRNGFKLAK